MRNETDYSIIAMEIKPAITIHTAHVDNYWMGGVMFVIIIIEFPLVAVLWKWFAGHHELFNFTGQ